MEERWGPWDSLDRDELYAILSLRQAVFVVEQRCFYQDADGADPRAWHLRWYARPGDGPEALVAYLRVFPPDEAGEAQIGRVLTAPSIRGTGQGRPLMRAGLAATWRTWGPCPVRLSAQAHLAGYYGSLGFVLAGEGYDEDGIPHVPMRHPGG